MVELNDWLSSDNQEIRQNATRVLMSVTLITEIRVRIIPETHLGIIAKLMAGLIAQDESVNYRLFCIKCMTNMCEVPKIRQFVYQHYHRDDDRLAFFEERVQNHYEIFVKILN